MMPHAQLIVGAVVLVVLAGSCAAAEAALARVSRSRVAELVAAGRHGARSLARIAADPAQTLSVTAFLRVLGESGAAVVVTAVMLDVVPGRWQAVASAVAIMTAASFVAVGVGPRTLGRQHADRIGLVAGPVLFALTRVLGPLARLLVVVGNVLTPGRGLRDGPFASEAELRELVDMAGETQVIEAGEREMIHSVFELGDTLTRFLTAGESHGPGLTVIVEGMPAGVPVTEDVVEAQLRRRQQGYGRGGRSPFAGGGESRATQI